ncbi:hypothetical protein PSECIP111951_03209 [Pseudoalteromonas holothuriae]|uniref:Uncharacterized protein n=1 Tax=Pseudoalteromonas holothuriae TaxID=2963714 RepID=A0A9W4VUD2_9GAMM|nr:MULTISPECIES: hypothetical protein [unclassified Pseudoalteromonas]CAH9063643.1 hypothetical protein PSECIP111854_03264 [Pseudoalteromonas sp. CIP111854]CAH9064746.1 hypothetical protein PSECIP111951_03209 [Pseudoalteromonas sp. CIP111951]
MKITPTIHQPAVSAKSNTSSNNSLLTKEVGKPLRLSQRDTNTLSTQQTEQSEKGKSKSKLPAHIEALIEQKKELKEQIEEQQKILESLKSRNDLDAQIKQDLVKQQTEYLAQLQIQLLSVSRALQDALKKSGVNDPSQLVDVLT